MSEARKTSCCSKPQCDGAYDMLQALLLRDQLASAKAQAQAANAEAATLQQVLDSERAAVAGVQRQLVAVWQLLQGERRLLKADREAAHAAAAHQSAAAEAAQRKAEADATRAELSSLKAQVHSMWLSTFWTPADACCGGFVRRSAGAPAWQCSAHSPWRCPLLVRHPCWLVPTVS